METIISLCAIFALILILALISRTASIFEARAAEKKHAIQLEIEKQNTIKEENNSIVKEYQELKQQLLNEYNVKQNELLKKYRDLDEDLYKKLRARKVQLEAEYQLKQETQEEEYRQKLDAFERLKLTYAKEHAAQEQDFKYDRQRWHIQQTYTKQNKELFETSIAGLKDLIKQECQGYPALAAVMADILTAHYGEAAKLLKKKKPPALKEAKRIRELQAETKTILKEKKELEYKLAYIHELFPNIDEIFKSGFSLENFELETTTKYNSTEKNNARSNHS